MEKTIYTVMNDNPALITYVKNAIHWCKVGNSRYFENSKSSSFAYLRGLVCSGYFGRFCDFDPGDLYSQNEHLYSLIKSHYMNKEIELQA